MRMLVSVWAWHSAALLGRRISTGLHCTARSSKDGVDDGLRRLPRRWSDSVPLSGGPSTCKV